MINLHLVAKLNSRWKPCALIRNLDFPMLTLQCNVCIGYRLPELMGSIHRYYICIYFVLTKPCDGISMYLWNFIQI